MPKLTDNSLMHFGKYKSDPLDQIPNNYFIWLEGQEWFRNSTNPLDKMLMAYIKDNWDSIDS